MSLGKFTDIVILLDRSPSMASRVGAVIESYNGFIADQRTIPGEARVTLAQFSGYPPRYQYGGYGQGLDFIYSLQDVPLGSVPELTGAVYSAQGNGTALRDAVYRLITERGRIYTSLKEESRPEKVVIVIQTDGEENSSREVSPEQLKGAIERQQFGYNWQFVYMGANQDAITNGANLGVLRAQSINYVHTDVGYANVFASTSENLKMFRAGAASSMSYSAADSVEAVSSTLSEKAQKFKQQTADSKGK